eukprot:UN10907
MQFECNVSFKEAECFHIHYMKQMSDVTTVLACNISTCKLNFFSTTYALAAN